MPLPPRYAIHRRSPAGHTDPEPWVRTDDRDKATQLARLSTEAEVEGHTHIVYDFGESRVDEPTVIYGNPTEEETMADETGAVRRIEREGFVIEGNPEGVPLHEAMGAMADWLDYEAAVVEEAAEELEEAAEELEESDHVTEAEVEAVEEIAEAAGEQAEAMEEAAEALEEASEEAAETAAKVYTETGVPADQQAAPVVAGNPAPTPIQDGGDWVTPWARRDSGGFVDWNEEEVVELVAGLDAGTYQTDPQTEGMLRSRLAAIREGNPSTASVVDAGAVDPPPEPATSPDRPPWAQHWYKKWPGRVM